MDPTDAWASAEAGVEFIGKAIEPHRITQNEDAQSLVGLGCISEHPCASLAGYCDGVGRLN
jgi:hypothetical protein